MYIFCIATLYNFIGFDYDGFGMFFLLCGYNYHFLVGVLCFILFLLLIQLLLLLFMLLHSCWYCWRFVWCFWHICWGYWCCCWCCCCLLFFGYCWCSSWCCWPSFCCFMYFCWWFRRFCWCCWPTCWSFWCSSLYWWRSCKYYWFSYWCCLRFCRYCWFSGWNSLWSSCWPCMACITTCSIIVHFYHAITIWELFDCELILSFCMPGLKPEGRTPEATFLDIRKMIFAILFSVHNIISLLRC